MRTLHVAEAYGGGLMQIVRTLADGQVARGDAVAIAHGRRPETPQDIGADLHPQVEVFDLGWQRRTPTQQVRAARGLRRLLATWKPDVVHLHSSFAGVIGVLALRGSVPTVYTPHGYSFTMRDGGPVRRMVYGVIERMVARRVAVLGVVSGAEAAAATGVAGGRRIVTVRNGIPALDDPPGGSPGRASRRPRVVTMGRTDTARRPSEASRILAAVSDIADVEWVGGAGRGGVPASAVTSQGVPLTGWLPHEEALAHLRAATACLHWAAWDGRPLSVLEAMAYDVVVVASDIPALRELVGPEQVCANEAEAIELLRRVVSDNAFRDQLLDEQARRRVACGAKAMIDGWRAVYETIADGRVPPLDPSLVAASH